MAYEFVFLEFIALFLIPISNLVFSHLIVYLFTFGRFHYFYFTEKAKNKQAEIFLLTPNTKSMNLCQCHILYLHSRCNPAAASVYDLDSKNKFKCIAPTILSFPLLSLPSHMNHS